MFGHAFRKVYSYRHTNFDQVSQWSAEILLLPVSQNKRPPSWNSTSGFNFDLFTVIGMWFCTGLPNFIADGVMMSYWFCKMAAIASQIYFRFDHVWHLGRSKAFGTPNFDHISQSMVEILLLPFSENKRSSSWNSTSSFDFDLFTVFGVRFSIGIPNFIEIESSAAELWRHSDFEDGGRQPCCIWFR